MVRTRNLVRHADATKNDTTKAPQPDRKDDYDRKLAGENATLVTPVDDVEELWRKWPIDYRLYQNNSSANTRPLKMTEYLRRLAEKADTPIKLKEVTVLDSESDGAFRIAAVDELADATDKANHITMMLLFYAVTGSGKHTLSFEDVIDLVSDSAELVRTTGFADTDDVFESEETYASRWRELDPETKWELYNTVTCVTRSIFRYGDLPPEEVAKRHLVYKDVREEYRDR